MLTVKSIHLCDFCEKVFELRKHLRSHIGKKHVRIVKKAFQFRSFKYFQNFIKIIPWHSENGNLLSVSQERWIPKQLLC